MARTYPQARPTQSEAFEWVMGQLTLLQATQVEAKQAETCSTQGQGVYSVDARAHTHTYAHTHTHRYVYIYIHIRHRTNRTNKTHGSCSPARSRTRACVELARNQKKTKKKNGDLISPRPSEASPSVRPSDRLDPRARQLTELRKLQEASPRRSSPSLTSTETKPSQPLASGRTMHPTPKSLLQPVKLNAFFAEVPERGGPESFAFRKDD